MVGVVLMGTQVGVAGPVTGIPLERRDGLVWVRVSVPQSPKPLRFLLDSGAGVSALNLSTAKRLGLRLGQQVKVFGVQASLTGFWPQRLDARVGSVQLPSEYLVTDLGALEGACDCGIDGLIGADFFDGKIVQLDLAAEELRILVDSIAPGDNAELLPLKRSRGAWVAPVQVNGARPVWVRLDTGCASALQWVTAQAGERTPKDGLAVGLSTVSFATVSADVQLGRAKFASVPTGLHRSPIFANERGLLGMALLSRFGRITIDGRAGTLVLENRCD
jgi:predicted aspartyl protease